MTPAKTSLAILALFAAICLVSAKSKLTWGDDCSVTSSILSSVIRDDDESKICDSDKGLICTGTCSCPPTRVWDKDWTFGLFGSGSCVVGANGPCSKDDKCVSNAQCGDNIPVCQCNDGYRAHDSQCISGSSKISGISALAFVGMIMSYFILGN